MSAVPFHVVVAYFAPQKAVSIFIDGKPVAYQQTEFDFNLKVGNVPSNFWYLHTLSCQTRLTIGRASDTDTEFFLGQIKDVQIFDYVLSQEQIRSIEAQPVTPQSAATPPHEFHRRTEDGRKLFYKNVGMALLTAVSVQAFACHRVHQRSP
eukprot:GHVT01081488.1.p1 GENE.GHVT01081488.1~~GHVT01081488.1.p1  ORF type:complete len:151 (+),score=12.06 GHVT01081488.1:3489-3941(+)